MSSKKGRHAPHEEHVDESWLIPYADILTLLLALFIVLFASSSVDQDKLNAMQEYWSAEFGGPIPEASGGESDGGSGYIYVPQRPDTPSESPSADPDDGPGEDGEVPDGAMGNLYSSLKGYIAGNNLENTVKVEFQGEKILVTMQNDIWFASGSADLTEEMKEKGRILAQILKDTQDEEHPYEIIVAGHTDTDPITGGRYPSNLHLSFYRAAAFQLFLIDESGLNPKYFSGQGYGEEVPIADNSTVEGKQKNRRVELLISQDKVPDEGADD